MIKKQLRIILSMLVITMSMLTSYAQVNTDQVMLIGRNTMYFEDYVLSIQYFNQAIKAKPYLAKPYFYRAVAKLNLDDYDGAEADATMAIERNPFITDAYELRGVARQNLGKVAEAVQDYDKALEGMPLNKNLLFNKALAQVDLKDFTAADSTFNTLLDAYPGYDGGYMGRARLFLTRGDTINALKDADHALEINKNSLGAHLLRADVLTNYSKDYKGALEAINQAIKLRPQETEFYINRAYIRYLTDDYRGAVDDYNYALQLDPINMAALFNRGLLLAEVHDVDNALADFSKVLELNPNDHKALFNRGVLNFNQGNLRAALPDLTKVAQEYPDFAAVHFMLSQIKTFLGDTRGGDREMKRSLELAHKKSIKMPDMQGPVLATQEQVKRQFTALQAAQSLEQPLEQAYNNPDIKGRVQDNRVGLQLLPLMTVTYYSSPTEIKPGSEYLREVQAANDTHALHFLLQVTINEPVTSDDEMLARHQQSIEEYRQFQQSHPGRAVEYYGLGMDFMTLRDYEAAITNFNKALEITPDFVLGYYTRGIANYRKNPGNKKEDNLRKQAALADFERVISLSPRMPAAYYNSGVILAESNRLNEALQAFSRAIEHKPDFGEAFYNRGYVRLSMGDKAGAIADLSKAGELGIVQAYNFLKKIRR